ncbi:MAG: hypothetical protein GF353_23460 [Candidatus Lokiarchaeota archaeon]|nr:hypothetical protein [Candidatus Lokiarchaeota archaeon]
MERRNRRTEKYSGKKTRYERERTKEEVKQIKKSLLTYAKTQWGRRWIISMLKIGRPFRMRRGINYAEDEKRLDNIVIHKGEIFSTVQGTAPTPYRVKIKFNTITDENWMKISKKISKRPMNLIELLEGNLPEEIINIFEEENQPLFLNVENEGLKARCSCPDQEVPCKHIAATILYIARVLDYNPFLILKLRGKTKQDLLRELSLSLESEESDITKSSDMKPTIQKIKEKGLLFNVPSIKTSDLAIGGINEQKEDSISFHFKKPRRYNETIENLGLPQNLDDPVAFEIVIKALYKNLTAYTYEQSKR